MIQLREILQECDKSLYSALMASWEIGANEWLPALKMESESHGGLPHIEQVEKWMNRIAEACRPIWSRHGNMPFSFNAAEIYIALGAVLFHDIGRGKKCDDHGAMSRRIVEEHWARLGIHNGRIAQEIALICEFHNATTPWDHHSVKIIHPWGLVHTEAIASLLTLADELDTAYTRTAPEYLKDTDFHKKRNNKTISLDELIALENDLFTKGLYREFIGSVELDPGSRLIKTVLFNNRLPGPSRNSENEESETISDWLKIFQGPKMENNENFKIRMQSFFLEDYFFSFLRPMGKRESHEIRTFLARQFQKALDFEHVELIQKFSPPASLPAVDNLVYMANRWDRLISNKPRYIQGKNAKALQALRTTKELVLKTINNVQEKIPEASKKYKFDKKKINMLSRILSFQKAYEEFIKNRKDALNKERTTGRKGSDGKLQQCRNTYTKIIKQNSSDNAAINSLLHMDVKIKFLNANDAHAVLLEIFIKLSTMDLFTIAKDLFAIDKSKLSGGDGQLKLSEDIVRPLESYTIEEYHANLLLAFQIYLYNVQILQKEENAIDFRHQSRGSFDSLIKNRKLCSEEVYALMTNLGDLFSVSDGKIEPNGKIPTYKEVCLRFTKQIENFDARWTRSGQQLRIPRCDFEFAVRFMFMQWLSGDIRTKKKQLNRIVPGLEKLEVPFKEWMIEYNNHLFDDQWSFRVEPTLSRKQLRKVLGSIEELSIGIHTTDPLIPWESLAAVLRDPDMDRVKTLANRLANFIRVLAPLDKQMYKPSDEVKPDTPDDLKNKGRNLHFGHLLMADCKLAASSKSLEPNDRMNEIRLDTSHSGWKFQTGKPGKDNLENLKDLLKNFLEKKETKQ